MKLDISGHYLTVLVATEPGLYNSLGPVVSITADHAVAIDGVPLTEVKKFDNTVFWQASENPSSGVLAFSAPPDSDTLVFSGKYFLANQSQPIELNFWGIQCEMAASPLTHWQGDYRLFSSDNDEHVGTLSVSDNTLHVQGSRILQPTFASFSAETIAINRLSWHQQAGNAERGTLSFFHFADGSDFKNVSGWVSTSDAVAVHRAPDYWGSTSPATNGTTLRTQAGQQQARLSTFLSLIKQLETTAQEIDTKQQAAIAAAAVAKEIGYELNVNVAHAIGGFRARAAGIDIINVREAADIGDLATLVITADSDATQRRSGMSVKELLRLKQ